eukprot:6316887-Amphidinium_carterae.1
MVAELLVPRYVRGVIACTTCDKCLQLTQYPRVARAGGQCNVSRWYRSGAPGSTTSHGRSRPPALLDRRDTKSVATSEARLDVVECRHRPSTQRVAAADGLQYVVDHSDDIYKDTLEVEKELKGERALFQGQ